MEWMLAFEHNIRQSELARVTQNEELERYTTMGKRFYTNVIMLFVTLTMVVTSVGSHNLTISKVTFSDRKIEKVAAPESTYRLSASKDVVMNLSGTTPVKNWSMSAIGLSGEAKLGVTANGLAAVEDLVFVLPVHNLKGEVKAMDEDAYEALKADQHKEITFKLISATIAPQPNNASMVEAQGTLTVAGVTRQVTLKMYAYVNRDGSVTFTGSKKLKMSDYDVERPSLLFGAIKASNDMTLTYKLIFTK